MEPLQRKNRPGTAAYEKGHKRLLEILQTARNIFIEGGYHSLTMRKIAKRAGITLSNLQYYYTSKQDLLTDLLDHVIEGYMAELYQVRQSAGGYPEDQLEAVIRYLIDDEKSKESTYFFPELWALANHDTHAAERMQELYRLARIHLTDLIAVINPKLSQQSREQVALFISASIEAQLLFIGYGKPFHKDMPAIKNIASKGLIDLVKLATNEDINPAKK